jgi:hypothetical protein
MFDLLKKYKEKILISVGVVGGAGAVIVLLHVLSRQIDKKTLLALSKNDRLLENTVAAGKEVADQIDKVAKVALIEGNGTVEQYQRGMHIRCLHKGWTASPEKIKQAYDMGIELQQGETLVNACTVTRRSA